MAHEWIDLLMNDHQVTEQVFDAVERELAKPDGPSPTLVR